MIKTKTISVVMIVAMLISAFAIFGEISQVDAVNKISYKKYIPNKIDVISDNNKSFDIYWNKNDKNFAKYNADIKNFIVWYQIKGDKERSTHIKVSNGHKFNIKYKKCIDKKIKVRICYQYPNPKGKKNPKDKKDKKDKKIFTKYSKWKKIYDESKEPDMIDW